ncbi:MAG: hypothetical protein ACLQM8_23940 [Limisphaerales bacterium]
MEAHTKPRGNSALNRLSLKRQDALFDFASVHTLAETAAWLRKSRVAASPSSLSIWLSVQRLRRQLRLNEAAVQTVVTKLQAISEAEGPKWDPEEVQRAGQAFFSGLAVEQQDPRIWHITQRLALEREQLALEQARFKESLRTKLRMGLEVIAEAFRENPQAMKFYERACALIDSEVKSPAAPQPDEHAIEDAVQGAGSGGQDPKER